MYFPSYNNNNKIEIRLGKKEKLQDSQLSFPCRNRWTPFPRSPSPFPCDCVKKKKNPISASIISRTPLQRETWPDVLCTRYRNSLYNFIFFRPPLLTALSMTFAIAMYRAETQSPSFRLRMSRPKEARGLES